MCTLPSQCMSQGITEEVREDLEAGTEVEAVGRMLLANMLLSKFSCITQDHPPMDSTAYSGLCLSTLLCD